VQCARAARHEPQQQNAARRPRQTRRMIRRDAHGRETRRVSRGALSRCAPGAISPAGTVQTESHPGGPTAA
jgi:hypothetical protein